MVSASGATAEASLGWASGKLAGTGAAGRSKAGISVVHAPSVVAASATTRLRSGMRARPAAGMVPDSPPGAAEFVG